MNRRVLRGEFLLLIAAIIWGFAFVAQRAGMAHVGPFTFNAIRFGLGALVVLPLAILRRRRRLLEERTPLRLWLGSGLIVGLILTAGASLQQGGLLWTTAGNAGFITGLYVLFVPLMGLFLGQQVHRILWLAAALAVAGLYLLAVQEGLRLGRGDLLILIGAFVWAFHVHAVARFAPRVRAFELAAAQFVVAAALSSVPAILLEELTPHALHAAAAPLLYSGFLSAGVAFTLQIAGQRSTPPGPAALLLALEAVFAALGGIWLLGEPVTGRLIAGASLLLGGILLAQLPALRGRRRAPGAPGLPPPADRPPKRRTPSSQ